MINPQRLKPGSHLRVIAPANSLALLSDELVSLAQTRLEQQGFTVSYGKHSRERDDFGSSSIESRLADLHEAFADKEVDGILTAIGGFNSNQLLDQIDYDLIRNNPKVLCGYSDITALQNAILAKTGLITYYGPHFSNFGEQQGFDYTQRYFDLATRDDEPFDITPSPTWSDDRWYRDQSDRHFIDSEGYWLIQPGSAQGTLVGGNLCTLNLLQGTPFMPSLKDVILFIEDDDESRLANFDRDLQSLLQLPDVSIKGLLIGRFEPGSEISRPQLEAIIRSKRALAGFPIIANLDFGHTEPHLTLPIGGSAKIEVSADSCHITVL